MQTSISAEEFARFQTQLLELREAKYAADADLSRATQKSASLELALARQSGELAELRARLSRIQQAGEMENLLKENASLRQRLLNVESSFQLQCSTLRAECERLQTEVSRDGGEKPPSVERETQTVSLESVAKSCQTYRRTGWANAEVETDLDVVRMAEWSEMVEAFPRVSEELEAERRTSEGLLKEVARREIDVERLEGECEALRSELAVAERRGERVQRELKRQLNSAIRAAKRASAETTNSLSSLVVVPSTLTCTDANLDGISVESFSLCGNQGVGGACSGENESETSSNSQQPTPQSTMFSEDDLKGLLARMSEVQEENCNLRHQLKHLKLELDAKSKIIQRSLNDKFKASSLSQHAHTTETPQHPASNATTTTTPMRLASDMIVGLRAKLKNLEAASTAATINSTELKGLKRLCEELMTRNISLERALEAAIAGASVDPMED